MIKENTNNSEVLAMNVNGKLVNYKNELYLVPWERCGAWVKTFKQHIDKLLPLLADADIKECELSVKLNGYGQLMIKVKKL